MNFIDLAVQSKRMKNFDQAIEYYGQEVDLNGMNAAILQSIAKVFYLKENNIKSVAFYLASVHLTLHLDLQNYRKGNAGVKQAIQQVDPDILEQFPHPIGALLFHYRDLVRHTSHALLDQESTFKELPKARQYAELYYSFVLGDNSAGQVAAKYNLTSEGMLEFEQEQYLDHGFHFLLNYIKWDEIDNPDVTELYFPKSAF